MLNFKSPHCLLILYGQNQKLTNFQIYTEKINGTRTTLKNTRKK